MCAAALLSIKYTYYMIPQNGEKCKGKTAGVPDEEIKRFCHRQNYLPK